MSRIALIISRLPIRLCCTTREYTMRLYTKSIAIVSSAHGSRCKTHGRWIDIQRKQDDHRQQNSCPRNVEIQGAKIRIRHNLPLCPDAHAIERGYQFRSWETPSRTFSVLSL